MKLSSLHKPLYGFPMKVRRNHKGPFTQAIFVAQPDAIFVAPKFTFNINDLKTALNFALFYNERGKKIEKFSPGGLSHI